VIFNWKGDLQKDHLLECLGIMTRAASNVATETSSRSSSASAQTTKFSHLHIVFRDWQAVGSSPTSVFGALFDREGVAESATRDRIRDEVLANFASVRVWLFDAPTESAKALKSRLTIDVTTAAFRQQLRDFRLALAQQLKEPTTIAGQVLTGRNLGPVMNEFGKALNSGQVVMPHSAFVNMITLEINNLRNRYENELTQLSKDWLKTQCKPDSNGFLPTEARVLGEFSEKLDAVVEAFVEESKRTFGDDFAGGIVLLSGTHTDSVNSLRRHCEQLSSHLLSSYRLEFSNWLRTQRQNAEAAAEAKLRKLLDANAIYGPKKLEKIFNDIILDAKVSIGVSVYQSTGEMADAVAQLDRFIGQQISAISAEHQSRISKAMPELVNSECQRLLASIPATITRLSKTNPTGVDSSQVEEALNSQYNAALRTILEKANEFELDADSIESDFENACIDMNKELKRCYNQSVGNAFDIAIQEATAYANSQVQAKYGAHLSGRTQWKVVPQAAQAVEDELSRIQKAALSLASEKVARWSVPKGTPSLTDQLAPKLQAITDNVVQHREGVLETARQEVARQEADRKEAERRERERQEAAERERQEQERRQQARQAQIERDRQARLESERKAQEEKDRIAQIELERQQQLEREREQRREEQERLRLEQEKQRAAQENQRKLDAENAAIRAKEAKRNLETINSADSDATPAKKKKAATGSASANEQIANAEKWFQANSRKSVSSATTASSSSSSSSATGASPAKREDVVAAAIEAQRKAEEERKQQAVKDAATWDKKKRGKK
jgi:hypothetical protein